MGDMHVCLCIGDLAGDMDTWNNKKIITKAEEAIPLDYITPQFACIRVLFLSEQSVYYERVSCKMCHATWIGTYRALCV